MRRFSMPAAGLAAAVLLLAGCTGGGVEAESPTATVDATAPVDTPTDKGPVPEHEAMPTVKAGEAFTVHESDGGVQDVVVTKVECGLTSIPKAATDDEGNAVTYHAPAGKQLFTVTGTVKNTGDVPIMGFANVSRIQAGGRLFGQSEKDTDASGWLQQQYGTDDINPGDHRTWIEVYSIPKGKTPDALQLSDDIDQILGFLALPE